MNASDSQKQDPFYRDGQLYDAINKHLHSDIEFYLEEALQSSGPILEIACGTGRITIPIAQTGLEIVGLDISEGMLSEAKKKAQKAQVDIEWVLADCRNFELARKFKLIFIPFNSMQHLHDLNSLESFFTQVKKHLAPGGQLILDVFNPNVQILARHQERYKALDLIDPKTSLKATIEEVCTYDAVQQINRVIWYYSVENSKDCRVDQLNMRCFFPQELDTLMKYNDFAILDKYGSFSRDSFTASSAKQILRLKPLTSQP